MKVEPSRALAARCRNEAKCVTVEEQTRGHTRLAEQPLHAAVGRRLELAVTAHHAIEILAWLEDAHEKLPGRCALLRLRLANGYVGAQRLMVVRKRHL